MSWRTNHPSRWRDKQPTRNPVTIKRADGTTEVQAAVDVPHVVYFVAPGPDGPIKIGITRDMGKRLGSLRIGSPVPLYVVKTIECDTELKARRVERDLHKHYETHRSHGEWFRLTAEQVDGRFSVLGPDEIECPTCRGTGTCQGCLGRAKGFHDECGSWCYRGACNDCWGLGYAAVRMADRVKALREAA